MFVHINKKASFTDELKSKYVNSIVFIKDTQEIWTHNTFYAIPEKYKNKISELEQKVNDALIFLTQEEYDLLGTDIKKDAIYIITNDKPELKIQGPFIARDGLLEKVDTIEDNNHYIFKVNNDYFFIYKSLLDISLPNDPSLYKQITGNFKILNTEQGAYEYCVPEVVNIESLDDIGMENLLRDIVIVDSFESYGSVAMNPGTFYSQPSSEQGRFYGFYVDSASYNISLDSDKTLDRYYNDQPGYITYNFPNYLCTYQIDNTNILIQKCLNRDNYSFYHYAQEQFNRFKTDSNIEEVELIRKSNDIYDRELTAIGKKINLDLNNRLDFGIDSDIIVGRIIKFKPAYLYQYEHVDYYDPDDFGMQILDINNTNNTNNVYWLKYKDAYLVLVSRSDKIIPEPSNVVKLRVKNDLSVLKYNASEKYHYFPVTIENIENFTDNDVSEFLSNIIVPAIDGIDYANTSIDTNFVSNPYPHTESLPDQDIHIQIQSSDIYTGLKIGKGNPDFTNTYEYRFSEYPSTFQDTTGTQYNLYYSPITVPGDLFCRNMEYPINILSNFNISIEPYISEVISTGTYKRLVYNTTIGFNCPSYIIPSLYYYLRLYLNLFTAENSVTMGTVELIAPSNCKYDILIKGIEDKYNIDLSNRFSYDEGTISNYMLLYVKTKTMN